MISLLRRAFVSAPFTEAIALLDDLVAESPGATLRFAVRAPVRIPSLGVEIALLRDVVATIATSPEPNVYAVEWRPAGDGPFPRFAGTVSLIDVDGTYLCLTGDYALPDEGILVADAFLAHRIAQATAGDVLSGITTALLQRAQPSAS
jgi:hypothetical protein